MSNDIRTPVKNTDKPNKREDFLEPLGRKMVVFSTILSVTLVVGMLGVRFLFKHPAQLPKPVDFPATFEKILSGSSDEGEGGKADGKLRSTSKREGGTPAVKYSAAEPVMAIGDLLNIAFFEDIYGEESKKPRGGKIPANIIERTEFSGKYVIHRNGGIYVPMLGAVKIAGLTYEDTTRLLQDRFQAVIGKTARVSLSIVEREPIYITGPMLKTSVFPYKPGLTVLHALVLSKNDSLTDLPLWQSLEIGRETERTRKSEERLMRLLARRAALKSDASSSGKPTLPARLIELAGEVRAREMVEQAKRVRALELSDLTTRKAMLEKAVSLSREEKKRLEKNIPLVNAAVRDKGERLKVARMMKYKKSITDNTYNEIRERADDAREKYNELMIALTRIEKTIAEEEHSLSRLNLETSLAIEKELSEIDRDVLEEEVTLETMGKLMKKVSMGTSLEGTAGEKGYYEVVRRTPEGLKTFRVEGMTLLEPGDILRLRINGRQEQEYEYE